MWAISFIIWLSICWLTQSYFTKTQWQLVCSILQNPSATKREQIKVKQLISQHYYHWTNKQYKTFITFQNSNKRRTNLDLQQAAHRGFQQAINKYNFYLKDANVSAMFQSYASKYIFGEMMTILKENRKMRKKINYVSFTDYWIFDNANKNYREKSIHSTLFMYKLNNNQYRIIKYKIQKKNIKEICDLLAISHETYRKRWNSIKEQISQLESINE
jgi:hypothetical protein